MHEHLPVPDQASRLRALAYYKRAQVYQKKPRVLTVASGKGGVGKSTIALNLAFRFAEIGFKTFLLDGDMNLGKLDVMLGVAPAVRVDAVLKGEAAIGEAILKISPRFQFLPAASGEPAHPFVSGDEQVRLLETIYGLDDPVDVLVIDAAAGIGREVLCYAANADDLLVVTTPEPTAIIDAYALMKIVHLANRDIPFHLIVNQASTPPEADDAAQKLQRAVAHFLSIHPRYAGFVPLDNSVHQSVLSQEPLVKKFPRSAASLSIGSLAHRLTALQ